jgi:hypothetical protein
MEVEERFSANPHGSFGTSSDMICFHVTGKLARGSRVRLRWMSSNEIPNITKQYHQYRELS